jgi:aspartate/methionine/tyrosine aminotransferase
MSNFPFTNETIEKALEETGVASLAGASIREVVAVVKYLEEKSGIDFIRMDMGVPGVPTPEYGIVAEIEALEKGKPSIYGQIDGIPELKNEVSRFAKNFLNIDVQPKSCIVTAGSMMGSMISFMVAAKRERSRQGVLFIDPGFPVQKKQAKVLNLPIFSFDIYNYRGKELYGKLEDICAKNGISLIIYSNPNNPTWICLTEEELNAIARVANNHDIVVVEDLAYFGMDFRHDYSVPGNPPYQPTIANYTDNYLILFSSSKVFSFAGQRVGAMMISDKLYERSFNNLLQIGDNEKLGPALVQDGVYVVSAGASHSAQYGLTGMLKAVNNGEFNFLERVKLYAERAVEMKKIFIENGFQILYDKDGEEELADGFYFTVTYPGLSDEEIMNSFFRVGLGTISLSIMGSKENPGVRISTSKVDKSEFKLLNERLHNFGNL